MQLCLQTKCFSTRFSFHSFLLCVAENEQRAALTSLHKDFGMRQGGSQELLSTGGIMAGQPPAGGGQENQIEHKMFLKEYNKDHQ